PFRAALISVSTSDGVRYSRGRNSPLLGRVGICRFARTDRFSGLPRLTGQRSFSGHFSAHLAQPTIFPVQDIHGEVNIPYRKKGQGPTPDQPHLYSPHAFTAPACGPRRLDGQTLSRLNPIRGHPALAGTEPPEPHSCSRP